MWQLEGEESHSHLLQFAINAENIDKSAILIVLDLSQPWNLVDHLQKWIRVAKSHISSLKLPRNTSEKLNANRLFFYLFLLYLFIYFNF